MSTWELFLIVDKFHIFKIIFVVLILGFVYEAIENKWDRRGE